MPGVEARTFVNKKEYKAYLDKQRTISTEQMKILFGGKWPEIGFNFDAVDHFKAKKGILIPMAMDECAPVPSFAIILFDDVRWEGGKLLIHEKYKNRIGLLIREK